MAMSQALPVIEGGYVRDILDQPRALEHTIAALAYLPSLASLAEDLRDSPRRRIVLTGMGSSYYACYPLLIELIEAGFDAWLVETSELIHYQRRLLTPDTVVLLVSQSGRSAEIVRLLEENVGGAVTIGITNDSTSPLAAQARHCVLLHAGEEHTVACKTYMASLVALAWVGAHLCKLDLGRVREEVQGLPEAVSAYLAHWREHTIEAETALADVTQVFLAGRGASLATAGHGGLILKEATHFPAEGMSAAAFRHGPLEMVNPRTFVVVFEGAERTAGLNARLLEDIRAAGGKAVFIGAGAPPSAFCIPPVAARVRSVVEVLPVEILSLAWATLAGREAGAFGVATKITTTE